MSAERMIIIRHVPVIDGDPAEANRIEYDPTIDTYVVTVSDAETSGIGMMLRFLAKISVTVSHEC